MTMLATAARSIPVVVADNMRIPPWVRSLESFVRWAHSDEFPETGRFSFLDGEIWVDPSTERLNHNQIKGIIAVVLGSLIKAERLGKYLHDRMLLTCVAANLSTEPDGMFLSNETIESGRALFRKGGDSLQVEGTADVVLEVVSPTSVHKDTEELRDLYARAGIPEYWLVDASGNTMSFEILRLAKKGYVSVRKQPDGWLKSAVFAKSFRLLETTDKHDLPEFDLEWR